jgi:hypothetical protein
MIRITGLAACSLVAVLAASCTTTTDGASGSRCPIDAYERAFGGGDFYSPEDRVRVSGMLGREEGAEVSSETQRRLVNILGQDATAVLIQQFAACKAAEAGQP